MQNLFLSVVFVLIVSNIIKLNQEISKTHKMRKLIPYTFLGVKFTGIQELFTDVKSVGYFTDKDLDDQTAAAQFSQAQYVLAPIILDLDHSKHEYVLFDCSSEEKAMEKIKELKLTAIKKNQFGIILAKRKK
ncbi:MAG: hypothetical protein A2Z88_02635 [Omnitrophica WOR_2 bacterium GWA2_47_8]|nr:MAG: hypothetical protein A2Z88_02635 [Omnitrophica WOR_2 bacterium GWA2_47_8]